MKKINIISYTKFQTIVFGLLGLLAGIIYSFGGLVIDTLVSIGWISSAAASTPGLSYGTVLAFGALVGMPVIGALFGFFSGLIGIILYNATSKYFGETKIDFEQ